MIKHLNYHIDKKRYRNIFFDNIQRGQWHWRCIPRRELFWYQLFIRDESDLKLLLKNVEEDLNIYGMNNFPRFSYQFPNTTLLHHKDEDNMVSININLLETTPTIHIEHQPYEYQCALIDVGSHEHGVESDSNHRLILKFCLRHPWNDVVKRFKDKGLL